MKVHSSLLLVMVFMALILQACGGEVPYDISSFERPVAQYNTTFSLEYVHPPVQIRWRDRVNNPANGPYCLQRDESDSKNANTVTCASGDYFTTTSNRDTFLSNNADQVHELIVCERDEYTPGYVYTYAIRNYDTDYCLRSSSGRLLFDDCPATLEDLCQEMDFLFVDQSEEYADIFEGQEATLNNKTDGWVYVSGTEWTADDSIGESYYEALDTRIIEVWTGSPNYDTCSWNSPDCLSAY